MSLNTGIRMAARKISRGFLAVSFIAMTFAITMAQAKNSGPAAPVANLPPLSCNNATPEPGWYIIRTPIMENGQTTGLAVTVTSSVGFQVTYTDIYVNTDTNPGTNTISTTNSNCSAEVAIGYTFPVLASPYPTYPTPATLYGTCVVQGNQGVQESNITVPYCNPEKPSTWTSHCKMPPSCVNPAQNIHACGSTGGYTLYCAAVGCAAGDSPAGCNKNYSCGTDPSCGFVQTSPCTPAGSPGATAPYCASNQNSTVASPCITAAVTTSAAKALSPQDTYTTEEIEEFMDSFASGQFQNYTLAPLCFIEQLETLYNDTNGCTNSK